MSSSVDGATSARIPSQPNGYSRSYTASAPSGTDGRQTPWKPSHPATTSQRSLREADRRPVAVELEQLDVRALEPRQRACGLARGEQVLHDLLLTVHGDAASAGQRGEVDPVAAPSEAQLDPVMDHPFAAHPLAHPGRVEQVRRALLEHSRADPPLEVRAAPRLDHDRLDPLPPEQVREQQPGRAGTHDPHLGDHV